MSRWSVSLAFLIAMFIATHRLDLDEMLNNFNVSLKY